ncbi:RHS repeat-associated core domain-containing protein [Lysobacter capsici]|uniref:RHS repeat-associated core domain-containing protein n=1 Tax=Lysobacter capsici TaxID=435897 RepID=UPI001C003D8C|nr:RHS repeat-associated core domain-containing protein [Lysobacter capsici]QWF15380.1 RHS repeat protein [Lysobacter capsici]
MSRRNGVPSAGLDRHPLGAVLALSIGAALCTSAQAQEAGKLWISNAIPAQPQLTEAGIQQEIKNFLSNFPGGSASKLLVTGNVVFGNKAVYNYDFEPLPPIIEAWRYSETSSSAGPEVGSIEALKAQLIQRFNQESVNEGCAAATTIEIAPDWSEDVLWDDDQTATLGFGDYTGTRSAWTGSQCDTVNLSGSLRRERDVACPNDALLSWRADLQACGGPPFQITYETAPLPKNECPVGNPCDPTTGDKSEPAPDFDLGWIAFDRHYHSMASAARSGFGDGWTHSHNIQLAMGTDPMDPNQTLQMGLIEADGSQVSFTAIGSAYEADDGSGDRVVADGADWLLYRPDRVLRFNANGRLTEQRFEDGTSLGYTYDASRRLTTITHSSGRSLGFEYSAVGDNAPIVAIRSAGVALASYTYTAGGQVETVTYAGGGTRTYHYEDTRFPRFLTGVTREDGQRYSSFAYDDKARVVSSTHAGGADAVTLTYPSAGGSIVTDALGQATTYGVLPAGNDGLSRKPTTFTDTRGSVTRTYLDAGSDFRRRLSTVEDRRNVNTNHSYTEANDAVTGQPTRTHAVTEAVGLDEERTSQVRTDIASNRVLMTVVGNRETRITRNARLQPVTVAVRDTTTNDVRTTTFAYCESGDVSAPNSTCPTQGLLESVDGPRTDVSDITTFEYFGSDDSTCATTPELCTYRKGDVRKTIDALGRATEVLGYDPQGRPLSVLDPNGVVTDYEYNARGWLTATKVRGANNAAETDDRITRIEHEPTGLVKKVTLPDGVFTRYTYDAAHRLTDVLDNAGNTIHYTLDLAGNRKQEDTKTAGGTLRQTLSRVFNTLGQLEALKDASQNATGFHYDANGNPDQVTDALLRSSTRAVDPLNRLSISVQDAGAGGLAAETKFKYNAFDQITQVTDPNALNTTYAYNGFGDRTKLTSPDTGVTDYTYNSAGLLATKKDANDAVAHRYTYDVLGRPKAVFYTAAGPADVEYDYDTVNTECTAGQSFATGGLTATRTEGNELKYCYDRFGQVVRKVQIVAGKSFTLSYTYTLAGNLDTLTYPDGTTVDYVRDSQARITEVGVRPNGGSRTVLLNNAAYEPFGPVKGWTYGNGRTLVRTYDLDYRPRTILDSASGGLSLGYGYNSVGELTELKDGLQSAFQAKYAYDTLGRLTVTQDPNANPLETYTYDKTGNRKGLTDGGGLQAYGYNSAGTHRLTDVAGVARGYDAAGNTTSIGGTAKEFVYSPNDRLRQFKQAAVIRASYRYNTRGERVATTGTTTSTIDTYTLYDETGNWIGDYDTTGAAKQQAIWFGSAPVGLVVGAGAAQTLAYVQPDHLGTPRAVIDPARNVAVWTWDAKSEVFGNSPPNQDPDMDGTAFVFNMRFPGQRYDGATATNYNLFRDYDYSVGRYLQSDPIGLVGGASTFAYVNSSPLLHFDPIGLIAKCKCTDSGVEIEIPIRFEGPGSTLPDVVDDMILAIESNWTSPGFTVKVIRDGQYPNVIDVPLGQGTSNVVGHSRGTWYAGSDPWVASHEAGHLMKFKFDGRDDMYNITSTNPRKSVPEPGWEGTIMADGFGVVDQRTRDAIISALGCKKKKWFWQK